MPTPSYLTPDIPSPETTDRQEYNITAGLDNNGFFPRIELRDFETRYHVNSSYSTDRKLHLLQTAIQQTNSELLAQVCRWNRSGYYDLESVPQQLIGDCGELTILYRQAVCANAMNLITERYRATDSSRYALKKADANDLSSVAEDYKNEYRRALFALTEQGQKGQSVFSTLI
jgi:hypothetical protein